MGLKCIICQDGGGGLQLFNLPYNRCIAEIWLEKLGMKPPWLPNHRICLRHFHETSYTINSTFNTTRLKKYAIPIEPYDHPRLYIIANSANDVKTELIDIGETTIITPVTTVSNDDGQLEDKNEGHGKETMQCIETEFVNVDMSESTCLIEETVQHDEEQLENPTKSTIDLIEGSTTENVNDNHATTSTRSNANPQNSLVSIIRGKRKLNLGDYDANADLSCHRSRANYNIALSRIVKLRRDNTKLRKLLQHRVNRIQTLTGIVEDLKKKQEFFQGCEKKKRKIIKCPI